MPLSLLRSRMLVVTNVTAALSAAAMFATFFLTLYLQRVLGKSPLQVSLIFLPTCLISAVLALGFSARIVNRYGIRRPFAAGLLLAALGLALLAGIPVQGDVLTDVFPGLSPRRVTVSTSGVVPRMRRFLKESRASLALSLNATTDETRTKIMPHNKTWPLASIFQALREATAERPARFFVEYVQLPGVNDTADDARRIAEWLRRVTSVPSLRSQNRAVPS